MTNGELLLKGYIFQSLDSKEVAEIADAVAERWVSPGTDLFLEGSVAESMFVIQSGTVEISKDGPNSKKVIIARLKEGAHFGEMAYVDRSPRAASAKAVDQIKVLEIKFEDLDRTIAAHPYIGLKLYNAIARTLCTRIRQTTSDLTSLFVP